MGSSTVAGQAVHSNRTMRERERVRKGRVLLNFGLLLSITISFGLCNGGLITLPSSAREVEDKDDLRLLIRRHNDEEHFDSNTEPGGLQSMASTSSEHASATTKEHDDTLFDSHLIASNPGHSHDSMSHHSHTHEHEESQADFYAVIPDPQQQSRDTFIPVPPLPHGAGGHSHGGHGAEKPKLELNETVIVQWKGPDPLSYIEWDFSYGIGKVEDLLRFSQAYNSSQNVNIMGVGGSRWRTLVDEKITAERVTIASDISQRAQQNPLDPGRHRTIMLLHIVGCIISCFILLPITLALRAAESSLAPLSSVIYLAVFSASLFVSKLYKAMTPQLYPSNSHGSLGYAVFWLSVLALSDDVLRIIRQIFRVIKMAREGKARVTLRQLLLAVIPRQPIQMNSVHGDASDQEMLLSLREAYAAEDEDLHSNRHSTSDVGSGSQSLHRVHFAQMPTEDASEHGSPRAGSSRQGSADLPSPTSTLCNNTPQTSIYGDSFKHFTNHSSKSGNHEKVSAWRQYDRAHFSPSRFRTKKEKRNIRQITFTILRYTHVTVARSIPVLSFAAAYAGLAVYTGSCRGPYSNTCLAHGIKGGIFFWYGLLSFARYLGAYANLGWAWNRQPTANKNSSSTAVSAEWVECFVIFLYGATNTWMERFGAAPGEPFSVKQIQHISIAVMFWFAGLMGMILETKMFKKLLALPVALQQTALNRKSGSSHGQLTSEEAVEAAIKPPSYNFSFNPFPALVIGVTGVAMAAHHQDYTYEVSIHQLWGNLLAGFSVFRILTYFFLWLRPPTSSIMPSRPPSEVLASFCLASGGLVFMLSSEEVSFAAMRNGFGDFMMILNVTVALVSLLFCGIAAVMILKALAVRHREKEREEDAGMIFNEGLHSQRNTRPSQDDPPRSVFVLGGEEDDLDSSTMQQKQEKQRQLSSSPTQM